MSIDSIYTQSEKTDKKYTVGFALASAKRRLAANRRWKGQVCTNGLRRRALTDKITLKEVNEIAEEIYSDSLYYQF